MENEDDLVMQIPLLELKDFNHTIEECVSYDLTITPSVQQDQYLETQGKQIRNNSEILRSVIAQI